MENGISGSDGRGCYGNESNACVREGTHRLFWQEECRKIREAGAVILLLPFGKDVGRKTSRILTLLNNQDCNIIGMVIAQADEEFLNRYFA